MRPETDGTEHHFQKGNGPDRPERGPLQTRINAFGDDADLKVIEPVEDYVNCLAHSPKEFDKSVREFRVQVDRFWGTVQSIETEAARSEQIGGAAGLSGAVAGVGLAALGPSAAVAVATTFGTASTGAAISTLSGVAASNAALAWLGGGAVAAGGGGMAAGKALLFLAGPVGWTIGGVAVVGSGVYLHYRNGELARRAAWERVRVEAELRSLRTAMREIQGLTASTGKHIAGSLDELGWLRAHAPNDYRQFDREQKQRLGALVNHILALGKLLRAEVTL